MILGATTLTHVETIALADGFSYRLTLNDATNESGLTVDGSLLGASRTVSIDGSAEARRIADGDRWRRRRTR